MEKIKKLLIIKFPYESAWGGEEEIHLLLAKKLQEINYETTLLTSCPHFLKGFKKNKLKTQKFWFRKTDLVAKMAFLILPFLFPLFLLSGIFWLIYFRYKGYKKVLMLRIQEKVFWTPIAFIFGFKIYWGEHVGFGKWFHKNPFLFLLKILAKFCTFIVPSQEMKRQVQEVYKKAKIKIIFNALPESKNLAILNFNKGVNPLVKNNFSKGIKPLVERNFSNLNIKKTDYLIGYAGRLSREKGLFFCLDLAQKISKKYPQSKFFLAGKGELENDLKQKIKEKNLENNVFLLGFLEYHKLTNFILRLDLLILFSDHETFGLSLLDGMSAGLPILATRVGGIKEIVIHKKTGLLFENGDLDKAFKYLEKLILNKDLGNKYGQAGQKRFLDNFTEEVFLKRLREIF